ncbi:DUF4926 domain-containing protein [Candidatus Bipolaricaulota bacterium]|nr:DUF4926 domain-containing protein [Candidatus Bipolaricaulota bacterium]
MPNLFDIIELAVDIPDRGLHAGMAGTIVDCHPDNVYEVEFADGEGETLDFLALTPDQFIVIWRAKTKTWVPVAERIAALLAHLSEEAEREVLDFVHFLYARKQQSQANRKAMTREAP